MVSSIKTGLFTLNTQSVLYQILQLTQAILLYEEAKKTSDGAGVGLFECFKSLIWSNRIIC